MKYYTLIFIGLAIVSIIFLILTIIFGQYYLFPFIFILPFSCEFRKRFQNYSNDNVESNESPETREIQNSEEISEISLSNKIKCNECNKEIHEPNLKFCPYCGSKLGYN